MKKITLEEKNAAAQQVASDREYLRLLKESDRINISGSVRGDGRWNAPIEKEDYDFIASVLQVRIEKRLAKNIKLAE